MINRHPFIQLTLATFVVAALLMAEQSEAQGRIGYVDYELLVENSPQAQVRKAALRIRFEDRYQAIATQEDELKALEDRLVRDTAVMSDERRGALERQIRNMRREVQRAREDVADELEIARAAEMKKLSEEVYAVVEKFAQEEGYDLILASPALYYDDSIDLTGRLAELLESAGSSNNAALEN